MSSFSASALALAAVSPAPTLGVSPSALPLSPLLLRAALAYVGGFRYAGGVMSRNYSPSPTFPPTASASSGCASLAFSVGRLVKSGRAGVVGLLRHFHSVAHRPASADSSPAAVACGVGVRLQALLPRCVPGGAVALRSGRGVATSVEAQPGGRPRSLRSLDAAR